ncbi:MAG: hypothetical protein JST48_09480 [Bacteroidetes bacterium]|nr:hypothetical protein [Bacteroidota bacterium]
MKVALKISLSIFVAVKGRILYSVSSAFLIGALCFAQIGVNFFHRNHEVHQNKSITAPLKGDRAAVQKHGEHCKVCAIDFFNHSFVGSESIHFVLPLFNLNQYQAHVAHELTYSSFAQSRAPPSLS